MPIHIYEMLCHNLEIVFLNYDLKDIFLQSGGNGLLYETMLFKNYGMSKWDTANVLY